MSVTHVPVSGAISNPSHMLMRLVAALVISAAKETLLRCIFPRCNVLRVPLHKGESSIKFYYILVVILENSPIECSFKVIN